MIAGMATIRGRQKMAEKAIHSVIDQVKCICVVQNGYKDLGLYRSPKVIIHSTLDGLIPDMGDANKFFGLNYMGRKDHEYISMDDDLVYPKSYVKDFQFIAMQRLEYEVFSHHGRVMKEGAKNYYKDKEFVHRCTLSESRSRQVEFPGTGVCYINNRERWLQYNHFESANCADVWMGIRAKQAKKRVMALSHSKGYIEYLNPKETLFDTEHIKRNNNADNALKKYYKI